MGRDKQTELETPQIDAVDKSKELRTRRKLVLATSAVGGAGLAASCVPFLTSMGPSERARAAGAPVEVDIDVLAPAQLLTVEWRGKPVWILRRTPAMLAQLTTHEARLADPLSKRSVQPASCANLTRSIKPEYLILVALCTHLGCIPTYRLDGGVVSAFREHAMFYCPCHGSIFDMAGRVLKGVPAPTNLTVPPHSYLSQTRIRVGEGA